MSLMPAFEKIISVTIDILHDVQPFDKTTGDVLYVIEGISVSVPAEPDVVLQQNVVGN